MQIWSILLLSYGSFSIILALVPLNFPGNIKWLLISSQSELRVINRRTWINRNSLSNIPCTCWMPHSRSHSIWQVTHGFHPFSLLFIYLFPDQVVHIQTLFVLGAPLLVEAGNPHLGCTMCQEFNLDLGCFWAVLQIWLLLVNRTICLHSVLFDWCPENNPVHK